jgi:hypothetical protein
MKLDFSLHNFEDVSDIKFIKIRPVEAKLFHAEGQTHWQTDGHDETKSGFLQFCEHA